MIDPGGMTSDTRQRTQKDSHLHYLAVNRTRSFPEESVINVEIISIQFVNNRSSSLYHISSTQRTSKRIQDARNNFVS